MVVESLLARDSNCGGKVLIWRLEALWPDQGNARTGSRVDLLGS